MDDFITITREEYEKFVDESVQLKLLERAVLKDAQLNHDGTDLRLSYGSELALNLLKIIIPYAYKARIEELNLEKEPITVKIKKEAANGDR